MPLHLGQLIYTSFATAGLKTLASPTVPAAIQQIFLQAVVHQYWNAYRPPEPGFQAIYLYQAAVNQTLFGWVYDDGVDDLGRSHVPYFLCYYLEEPLHIALLERICDCLEQGPLLLYDRQQPPAALDTMQLPEGPYTSAQPGIKLSADLWVRSQQALRQNHLLNWFISADGQEIRASAFPTRGQEPPLPTSKPPEPTAVKVALLIGTSHCAAGFRALAGVEKDVAAMQQVLTHPQVGGFTVVQTLINSSPQMMAEAIEQLCGDRRPDDLILVYFSGHALQDDKGNLYWSTGISRRDAQGKLVRSSMLAASFVQDVMNQCTSQHQVVILDTCWNDGVTPPAPTPAFLNFKQQLGGQERALLTASASTSAYLCNKGADRSAYTFYLVEGLKTGVADLNGDGIISLPEWHEYACRKVQVATPALQPQLYGHLGDQGFQIARAPLEDPKLQYRQGVETCISQSGKITLVNRTVLDALQDNLGLRPEEAASIEAEVLKPHQIYQKKLQVYAQHFVEAMQRSFPLSPETEDRLQQLRSQLGLTAENTGPLEGQLSRQLKVVQAPLPALAPSMEQSASQEPLLTSGVQALALGQGVIPVLTHRGQAVVRALSDPQRWRTAAQLMPGRPLWASRQTGWRVAMILLPLLLLMGLVLWLQQRQSRQDARQLQAIAALAEQRNYESCLSQWQQISRRSQNQSQQLRQTCEAGLNWQNSQSQILRGHQGPVWTVTLSPKGQTIASAGADQEINLWSLNTGKLLRSLTAHTDTVWAVAISPDGQLLASGSADQTVQLWDISSGQPLQTFSDHRGTVWAVAFSADSNLLASSSEDGTVKLRNIRTGDLVRTLEHRSPIRALAFSPDGKWLASGSNDQTIGLWNLETGKLERALTGHQDRVIALALSPDGKWLASGSGDQTLKLWDLETGKLQNTLSGYPEAVTGVAIALTGSGLSSQSQPLLASSSGNTLKLWNGATGEAIHTFPAAGGPITAVGFSPDGLNLIAANQDQTVTVWQR